MEIVLGSWGFSSIVLFKAQSFFNINNSTKIGLSLTSSLSHSNTCSMCLFVSHLTSYGTFSSGYGSY